MKRTYRWILIAIAALFVGAASTAALIGIAVILAQPHLPPLDAVTDYRPRIPLRIYSADGYLIGEFGEERRSFITAEETPDVLKAAIIAAEDERFYQHAGIDVLGVARAAYANLIHGGRRQGASTITMQVARNFFLSSEKTLSRKLYEALLAIKIEKNLDKAQILQLYINQIYLGQRAYGFGAAAKVYFGKHVSDLSLAEAAILAGLPKAPSAYNPVANPSRAKLRQQYVLRRMRELGTIDASQYEAALNTPIVTKRENVLVNFAAPADHVAEMARQIAYDRFGDDAYTRGYKVITTIRKVDQTVAFAALREGVMAYDKRHGYRGPEAFVKLPDSVERSDEQLDDLLVDFSDSRELRAALVLETGRGYVLAYRSGETFKITGEGLSFALPSLDSRAPARSRLRAGAIVRIVQLPDASWAISQLPEVEAAFVAADPKSGAIRALVGGFDFNRNKFNHVTQAWRQAGSNFKPFIFSAALERGFTPASFVEDTPVLLPPEETNGQPWEPKNYDDLYDEPVRLRVALAKSKNMVAIRVLQAITPEYARDFASRFGLEAERHPAYLTMALGSGAVSPWQMLTAYSVFANGGYKIAPYLVSEIRDNNNQLIASFSPEQAGDENLRIIDARNSWLMDSMLRDVVAYGTAASAGRELQRGDLAGKTGTTNDYIDAWFAGYHPSVVAVSWVGFDQPKRLGNHESGGRAALPMWTAYMKSVLADAPEALPPEPPPGLAIVQVLDPSAPGGIIEDFMYEENVPAPATLWQDDPDFPASPWRPITPERPGR